MAIASLRLIHGIPFDGSTLEAIGGPKQPGLVLTADAIGVVAKSPKGHVHIPWSNIRCAVLGEPAKPK